jgi:RNA polymerase sigma-70 factor, ECF subfamily
MALQLVTNSKYSGNRQPAEFLQEEDFPNSNRVYNDNMTTSVQVTDQQLVERVQRGDRRAFDLLVVKYQTKVMAIISRYVRDSHEVMDISQEAFLKAYRAMPGFRGESAFYTWLYRIAINSAKNYLVAQGRRPPGSDVAVDDAMHYEGSCGLKNDDTPESQLHKEQLQALIYKAIEELPDDLRSAFSFREFDGLSYEEIADVMKCPVGTVRSRIFRARDAVDASIAPLLENKLRTG